MPRYFLHFYNGTGFVEDEEGQELADREEARAEAIAGIRSVLASEVLNGSLDLRGRVEIVDSAGAKVGVVPFGHAVTVRRNADPDDGATPDHR